MPCTAKKFEALRPELAHAGVTDVDAVLTTRQFARLIRIFGIDFATLPEEEFDKPFGASTGSGDIFAASGGVMESALRSAYYLLTGKDLEKLEFEPVRGMAGVKEASITIGDRELKIAVANRLGNARQIADRVKAGDSPWQFIEVMACPGGCAGGGGQLFGYDPAEGGEADQGDLRAGEAPGRSACRTRTRPSRTSTGSSSRSRARTRRTSCCTRPTRRGRPRASSAKRCG